MVRKFSNILCCLFIILFFVNGCATSADQSNSVQNNLQSNEQPVSEVNSISADGEYDSGKELAMQIGTFFLLPVFIPLIFLAALFSGVG